jgi:hypothetical protein
MIECLQEMKKVNNYFENEMEQELSSEYEDSSYSDE